MKPSTIEWIEKAESDYQLGLILSRKRKNTFFDQGCFLCQQSAEKYLKARLEEAGIRFPKVHDLDLLLQATLAVEPLWAALRPSVLRLTGYAVKFRYPGSHAGKLDLRDAIRDAGMVRTEARQAFGLP